VSDLTFRDAAADDILSIVRMYADDALGQSREDVSEPLCEGYLNAFHEIEADPRHRLVVVIQDGEIVGTLQLSFLPHLVLCGGRRAQIEAVRVRVDQRGMGHGKAMFEWAIEQARLGGCRLVQLTTNNDREGARRFYAGLGFEPTHVGMKLVLNDS
jgi:GNAT superfamily N-acetyltransferase